MRLRKSHLSFEKIAYEWARELDDAKRPGRLNRGEIFLEMVRGIWRGEFENAALTIDQAPRYRLENERKQEWRRYKPPPMRVTRETLDKVVLLGPGVRPNDPEVSRWEFRASLKLEDYEPLSLRTWLEPLTISKEDFGRWCDDHGHVRPKFWFGDAGEETGFELQPPPMPEGRAQAERRARTAERNADIQRQTDLIFADNPNVGTKDEVLDILLRDREFPDHRQQDGKPLTRDTLMRIFRIPPSARKRRLAKRAKSN